MRCPAQLGQNTAASLTAKARKLKSFKRIGDILLDYVKQMKLFKANRKGKANSKEKGRSAQVEVPENSVDSAARLERKQPKAAAGMSVDDLIYSELTPQNSLNGLAGQDFKKNALIDYHINPHANVLTQDEYLSLHLYTTNMYEPINNGLRGLSPVDKEKWSKVAANADSALEKLSKNPKLKFEGVVIRGDNVDDMPLEELFPKDGIHKDLGFKSSSYDPGGAFNGNTVVHIKSKNGVLVEDFSVVPSEKEVLFRPGTEFKVKSSIKVNGKNYIELEEI